jgi:hypothetical protein
MTIRKYFLSFAENCRLATKALRHEPACRQRKKCVAFFFSAFETSWLNSIFVKIVYQPVKILVI